MPFEITVPRLGWSMEEGVLAEWLKEQGEFVNAGDVVFMLEGEKAVHEIEALDSGTLHLPSDAPAEGDAVRVGQVIGFLLADGEQPPSSIESSNRTEARSTSPTSSPTHGIRKDVPSRAAGPAARRLARQLGIDLNAVPTPDPTGRVIGEDVLRAAALRRSRVLNESSHPSSRLVATPRARRRAGELGIDWRTIRGTGRNGRVRERDVLSHTAISPANRSLAHRESSDARTQSPAPPSAPGRFQPATMMRRTIAQRMLAAVHHTAPVTLTTKVDASALVVLRSEWKAAGDVDPLPSYNDILVKLTATVLREHPELNACWHNGGIWTYDEVNVGVAVDTEPGLVAPVIRDADKLSLKQIAECSRALTEQARTDTLSQSQLEGGTITVTNLGGFGIDTFTPIINLPQAAILGIGRIIREPVVREDRIEVGHTLRLSLTFDHQVIDGAPAARWLEQLCTAISECRNDVNSGLSLDRHASS